MGTRCNVKINDKENTIWIYRHWDGYPNCTGAELKTILEETKPENANRLAELLTTILKDDYRYTNSQHGDIEYLYEINISENEIEMRTTHLDFVLNEKEDKYEHKEIFLGSETFKR